MSGASPTSKKLTPSVPTGGVKPAKRLYLRAANDNRAPFLYRAKKLSMILLPAAMLLFFAGVWYFGGA
ncbi:MAG: hypothetical protein CMN56_01880 [Sneathiella sp.]|uniref:hypothetical protein n=1 Tax=Sneathiella sp. TaxID=1964365 RepID=UPI000C4A2284|nr:hypothetical protein [Sneathiella sp.]MAZ01864.1 hypothetical protein [Sneathiella sp.]|tara:strand:+ start:17113 stop:17316 length:204 start_codon:yes stop_codon:yes gene_type:complete